MLARTPVGRQAPAFKYDLLTAMGAYALAQPKGSQRLVLRLMTLMTARYNWARDELCVGQREIARLWGVDERTVKREMAKLRAMGWLVLKRAGARGRVAEHGLDTDAILQATRPQWPAIGPDFEIRMTATTQPEAAPKVVALPVKGRVPEPDLSDASEWSVAAAVLHAEEPALYGAWVHPLRRAGRAGGRLTLAAPSRFHAAYVDTHLKARLLRACRGVDEDVHEIVLTV